MMLAAASDCNLMDAFQLIDRHRKGRIIGHELLEALSEFCGFQHKDDVYLFVKIINSYSGGQLLYSDFCEAFTLRILFYSKC
jgi:Ca2+-binding EF-hand superfamily protein